MGKTKKTRLNKKMNTMRENFKSKIAFFLLKEEDQKELKKLGHTLDTESEQIRKSLMMVG